MDLEAEGSLEAVLQIKNGLQKELQKKERAEGVIAKKGAAKRYSDEAVNKNAMDFAAKARKWRKSQKSK